MPRRAIFIKVAGFILFLTCAALVLNAPVSAQAPDPLSSWNEGPAKQAIVSFVQKVTDKSSPAYVPPEDRLATFDQDGTLWVEQPLYAQAMFALDRLRDLAPGHPEWQAKQPYKAVLTNDQKTMAGFTEHDWVQILVATQTGMTTEAFLKITREWLARARHPRFKRPYTELVYQPMLEVMQYLRNSGFKTYIVTGGDQEFVRAYGERVYDVPPEQVVGSSMATKFEYRQGQPVLLRLPKVFFIDDHAGKPIGINLFIGKRPQAAFGNSAGDQQMLDWTQTGGGARLMMLVLHDDAKREYAYGPATGLPDTKIGTFTQALWEEARKRDWVVISMKKDWQKIFVWE